MTVDRKKVDLGKPIKVVGVHQVAVSIYREIKATVNVKVAGEGGELEMLDEALDALQDGDTAPKDAADEAVSPAEQADEAAAQPAAEDGDAAAE